MYNLRDRADLSPTTKNRWPMFTNLDLEIISRFFCFPFHYQAIDWLENRYNFSWQRYSLVDYSPVFTFYFYTSVKLYSGHTQNKQLFDTLSYVYLIFPYLGDCANCCAAVTASSVLLTTMGTLLQPGCFRTRSNCRTVRSTVVRIQRSTLLMTMKMGTFRAMAIPRCSRVVPAGKEKGEEEGISLGVGLLKCVS